MDKKKECRRYISSDAAFATHALGDEGKIDPETGATTPTEQGVIEAKEFVDGNKK